MKIKSGERRKVALITGAAGTLGWAVAKRLSKTGYQIVAVDRDNEGGWQGSRLTSATLSAVRSWQTSGTMVRLRTTLS